MERQPSVEATNLWDTLEPLTQLHTHELRMEQLMDADRQLYGERAENMAQAPDELAQFSADIFHQITASVSNKYDEYCRSPNSAESSIATRFNAIFDYRKQEGQLLSAKTLVILANFPIVTSVLEAGRELQIGLLQAKSAFTDMPQAYDRLMFAVFRDSKLVQLPDRDDVAKYQLAAGVGRQLAELAWQTETLNVFDRVRDVRSISVEDIAIRFTQMSAEEIDSQLGTVPNSSQHVASKALFKSLEERDREKGDPAYHKSLFIHP
jgi:hypothetical protein